MFTTNVVYSIDPNPKKSRDFGILRFGIFWDKNPKIPGFLSRDLGSRKNPIPEPPLIMTRSCFFISSLFFSTKLLKCKIDFNLSVPDSLIWVGSRLRQIGTFRPSRKNCTRLRHRGWCQKAGRQFFYHKLKLELLSNHP